MFGGAFQAAAQPRREKIDRFSRGLCLDLSAERPAIDIEIGLRDHGPLHRRIAMPHQFDTGVRHRSADVPAELADLAARIRVSLRAQQLGTPRPVSEQRIYRAIDAVLERS